MFPTRYPCTATVVPRSLQGLNQCSHWQAHIWSSCANSFVQVQQHTKSRWAVTRLLSVLFHIQLGQDHVHSDGERTSNRHAQQDLAWTLYQAWGSIWRRQRYEISVWLLWVYTHQERVQLRVVPVEEEFILGCNILDKWKQFALLSQYIIENITLFSWRVRKTFHNTGPAEQFFTYQNTVI